MQLKYKTELNMYLENISHKPKQLQPIPCFLILLGLFFFLLLLNAFKGRAAKGIGIGISYAKVN